MRVDRKATASARKRQEAGITRLREFFGWSPEKAASAGLQHGHTKPVRLKPNTPPIRDAEHARRHRKRKIARASRKRNRRVA